jgi:hypothetical protein
MHALTGRRAALAALAACCSTALAPARSSAAYTDVADRLALRLGALWNEQLGRYDSGGGTVTEVNADLLLVHSVAAQRNLDPATHPARDDRRAVAVARFLTGPEVWRGGAQPGWQAAPDNRNLHEVFGAEAADGLAAAYRAREALGLDAATVDAIRGEIGAVAASPQWRWPALVLNQINWYVTVAAARATVDCTPATLADSMRRHLARFLATRSTFGPGLRFRYQPARWPHARMNFDSPEYANIVLGFARFYGEARRAGMAQPAQAGLLREWVRRALAGYWTHAGYLNWDTGLGFSRWHQRKKVALSQLALIGIAAEPELWPDPRWGAWAKWLLDRGLESYVELTEREGRIPAALAYGVHVVPQSRANAYLAAARHAANAMRALDAGLEGRRSEVPPALYAYDPDTGRLAVTTPAYNTAIVAANQGAFPYGGLDIARLFDSRQEVAASIGGLAPAAFGLRVRDRRGRTLIRTQYGSRLARPGSAPLRLVRAPRGVGARPASVARAYAGPFTDLRVRGAVRAHRLRATSAYRFTARWIEGHWTVRGRRPAGSVTEVTFPSWGRRARVLATLRDGPTVRLGARPLALAGVRSLHVISARSGYRVVFLTDAGAVRLLATTPQSSAPDPGPSAAIVLGPATRLAVRIVVD